MRKVWKRFLGVLGVLLIVAGVAILAIQVADPDLNERIIYGTKTKVEAQVEKVKEEVTGEYPTVLIKQGTTFNDAWELDHTSNHEYVLMESYKQVPSVLPVYSAHNGLGGSNMIEWKPGQRLNVLGDGKDGVYVIAEELVADKFGTVDQAEVLQNAEFLMQTCFWGQPYVKFISLVPEEEYEKGWPPEISQSEQVPPKVESSEKVQLVVED